MHAATTLDDSAWDGQTARGWSVMNRLRERQRTSIRNVAAATARLEQAATSFRMMTAAVIEQDVQDRLAARWGGNWSVVAMLFAFPDEDAMSTLDSRGGYFDTRTGDVWDLLFPGYFVSTEDGIERGAGSQPVGKHHTANWWLPSGLRPDAA